MKFMTFEEWLRINPVDAQDCPECEGEGRHSCSCGHEHKCESCDGTGRLFGADPLSEARNKYEAEVNATKARLAAWGVAVG